MQKYTIKKGTTSKILLIDIYDSSSTVGGRLAGLVYNSAGLSAYYNREGAAGAATAITLVTATKGTFASGGFVAIDATNMAGHYELHIPDAALATGANSVLVVLKGATNMVPKDILIELVDNVEADTYAIVNNGTYGNSSLNTDLDTLIARIVGTLAAGTHNPQGGDAFARLGAPAGASVSADIAGVQSDADNIQTRLPAALVGGRMDSSVGSNLDKTGYSLSSAGIQAIWDALTSALTTVGSVGKLLVDNVNATISSRSSHTAADVWSVATRTLTSFGTLVSDIWANATRTLTGFSTALAVSVWDVLETAILTASSIGLKLKTNLDATISSRASQTSLDAVDDYVDTEVAAIKAKTDQLTFTTANQVDANALSINSNAGSASKLQRSTAGITTGTVGAASTTTSIVTSALSPAAAVIDQFKGKIVTFDSNTTTAALRSQSTDITANTAAGVLTVSPLTTSPVSGDVFVIT